MRRANQALPDEEIREVLRTAKRGVLAMTGDGGRPYCIYLNPFYDEDTGRLRRSRIRARAGTRHRQTRPRGMTLSDAT